MRRLTRRADWVRLLCFAVALILAACGYYDELRLTAPWWRSLVALGGGVVLVGIAFGGQARSIETSRRRAARWAAELLAVAAAAGAVVLVPRPGKELWAGIAVIVAVVGFILGRWVPFAADDVSALCGTPDGRHPEPGRVLPWLLGAGAVLATGAAAMLNPSSHLTAFLLWLAALAAFAAAMREPPAPEVPPATGRWREQSGPQMSRMAEYTCLLLILALALVVRVPHLLDNPATVNRDEGIHGRTAERLCANGFPDLFGYSWNAFPNMSFLAGYIGNLALGPGLANLRAGSVVWGTLSLVPMFFWVRRWWGNVVATLATLLLAVHHEHVLWSRWGFNNIQMVFVGMLLLAAFARALETRRRIDWVWVGYAAALCGYTYHAAKLLPLLLGAAAVLFALAIPGFARQRRGAACIVALAFFVCATPLLATTYKQWAFYAEGTSGRVDVLRLVEAYQRGDTPAVRAHLGAHVYASLRSFIAYQGDAGYLVGPELCVLFLLGIGWMAWRWRDPRHLVVLLWTLGILVVAGMMTHSAPNKPRMLGFVPMLCLIPAVVAGRLRGLALRGAGPGADWWLLPLAIASFSASLYQNWHVEFVDRADRDRNFLVGRLVRLMETTPLPATLFMLGTAEDGSNLITTERVGMFAPDQTRTLVQVSQRPFVPLRPEAHDQVVFVFSYRQRELLPLLLHYYPAARHEVWQFPNGHIEGDVVTIDASEVARWRGLEVIYRSDKKAWTAAEGQQDIRVPANEVPPLEVTARGLVFIEPPGTYGLRSLGAAVAVDGRPLTSGDQTHLAAGWHQLELRGVLRSATDHIVAEWRRPGSAEWTPIPRASLAPHEEMHGLLGRYYEKGTADSAARNDAPPDYEEIDPVISFETEPEAYEHPVFPFAKRPSMMEWAGTVDIPDDGPTWIRLEATDPTTVYLGGSRLLSTEGGLPNDGMERLLDGVHGTVPIVVRSRREAGLPQHWKLRLLWRSGANPWTAFVDYHLAQ